MDGVVFYINVIIDYECAFDYRNMIIDLSGSSKKKKNKQTKHKKKKKKKKHLLTCVWATTLVNVKKKKIPIANVCL
jgi:phage-related protein